MRRLVRVWSARECEGRSGLEPAALFGFAKRWNGDVYMDMSCMRARWGLEDGADGS